MHFPRSDLHRITDPKQETGPRMQRFGGQFEDADVESRILAESGSAFVRHDRHTIALIFTLEVILFVADFFKLLPVTELMALRIGLRTLFMMTLVVAFFHYFSDGSNARGTRGIFVFGMAFHNLLRCWWSDALVVDQVKLALDQVTEMLDKALSSSVDAIVTDLSTLRLDGLSSIRRLRRRFPQVAIVAITGADAYLSKHRSGEEVVAAHAAA